MVNKAERVSSANKNMKFIRRGFFLILYGAIFALIGIIVSSITIDKEKQYFSQAVGTVVDVSIESRTNSNNEVLIEKYAIVKYFVGDDRDYILKTSNASDNLNVGDNVDILFNPSSPNEAVIKTSATKKAIIIIFRDIGVAIIIFGAVYIVYGIIRNAKSKAQNIRKTTEIKIKKRRKRVLE